MSTEKQLFRERLRAASFYELLEKLDSTAASKQAIQRLQSLTAWKNADAVFSFVSVAGEMSSETLNQRVLETQKVLALPRVGAAGKMDFFRIDVHRPLKEQLVANKWKLLEPDGNPAHLVRPRDFSRPLFIIPGVAFGYDGRRLGRGGGFYDRYLEGLEPAPTLAGWCFDEQIIDDIPVDKADMSMSYVVTPTVCLSFSGY